MGQFFIDVIGYVHDNVPRWAKLTIVVLVLAILFFFFGFRPTVIVIGSVFWLLFGFLLVAHIGFLIRNTRKRKTEHATVHTSPEDEADVREFQEAMGETTVAPVTKAPIKRTVPAAPVPAPQKSPTADIESELEGELT
jgi:hypothetical protein